MQEQINLSVDRFKILTDRLNTGWSARREQAAAELIEFSIEDYSCRSLVVTVARAGTMGLRRNSKDRELSTRILNGIEVYLSNPKGVSKKLIPELEDELEVGRELFAMDELVKEIIKDFKDPTAEIPHPNVQRFIRQLDEQLTRIVVSSINIPGKSSITNIETLQLVGELAGQYYFEYSSGEDNEETAEKSLNQPNGRRKSSRRKSPAETAALIAEANKYLKSLVYGEDHDEE